MTDIEIARKEEKKLGLISNIAEDLGIDSKDVQLIGSNMAKIDYEKIKGKPNAKLILVTAINPTSAGEGKTTVSIGLADALNMIDKKTMLALREPSLGPVFGTKGGATGGGYSQVVPMEEINLHFTGDFHAITTANNLLCAMIDNHIFQGNELDLDVDNIFFNRCMDMNDRALRSITVGESGLKREVPRKDKFNITAASEIMAIMCLSKNLADLKRRLGNITIGLNSKGESVYAKDLRAENAMTILLKNALKPNLVQTLAGTPCFIHCGPFANIAHGCNSIIATKTAMKLAYYVVTEAGFGADLGAEKFLDVKCQIADLKPSAVVIVATVKALKLHGGASKDNLMTEDVKALKKGCENLKKHIENIKDVYKLPCVVAINRYLTDTKTEIETLKTIVEAQGCEVEVVDVWGKGGLGTLELAKKVSNLCGQENKFTTCYDLNDSIETKLEKIVTKIYGAKGFVLSDYAKRQLEIIKKQDLEKFPVVVAKTQYSLSDDQKLLNRPKDFVVNIRDLQIRTGSEFIVAVAGDMMLMPGLGKTPAAVNMHIDDDGTVEGLF